MNSYRGYGLETLPRRQFFSVMGDLLVLCADGVAISPAPLMHGWLSHGVDAVCIVAAQGLYQLCVVWRDAPVVGIRPQAALLLQC